MLLVWKPKWKPKRPCRFRILGNETQSSGFDLGVLAALTSHLTVQFTAAYADACYTQTTHLGAFPNSPAPTQPPQIVATRGDAIGALPLASASWTAFASVD